MKHWQVIIIPADPAKPIQATQISSAPGAMQEKIGGWIEHVRIGNFTQKPFKVFEDLAMWVDEDGIAKGLFWNPRASLLYGMVIHKQRIFGDALITGEKFDPIEGRDPASIPDWAATTIFWDNYFKKFASQA